MTWLTTPPDCATDDRLCRAVLNATGNSWLATAADWLIARPLAILGIVVLALFFRWLAIKLVRRLVGRAMDGVFPTPALRRRGSLAHEQLAALERRRARAETLGSVLTSIASFVIFTIAAMMVMSKLGLDIGPLIASAGLVGVALGFGAQSLVKDFLSGIFLFFEDQYGVGDEVLIGDTKGYVEALALRVTRIRGEDGTMWYVRNGEILKVGNLSQRVPSGSPHGDDDPE